MNSTFRRSPRCVPRQPADLSRTASRSPPGRTSVATAPFSPRRAAPTSPPPRRRPRRESSPASRTRFTSSNSHPSANPSLPAPRSRTCARRDVRKHPTRLYERSSGVSGVERRRARWIRARTSTRSSARADENVGRRSCARARCSMAHRERAALVSRAFGSNASARELDRRACECG